MNWTSTLSRRRKPLKERKRRQRHNHSLIDVNTSFLRLSARRTGSYRRFCRNSGGAIRARRGNGPADKSQAQGLR